MSEMWHTSTHEYKKKLPNNKNNDDDEEVGFKY